MLWLNKDKDLWRRGQLVKVRGWIQLLWLPYSRQWRYSVARMGTCCKRIILVRRFQWVLITEFAWFDIKQLYCDFHPISYFFVIIICRYLCSNPNIIIQCRLCVVVMKVKKVTKVKLVNWGTGLWVLCMVELNQPVGLPAPNSIFLFLIGRQLGKRAACI